MPHLPKEVRCFFVCASCTLTSERGRSRLVWGSCSAFYTYFRLIVLRESGAAAAKRLHRKAPVYPLKSWKKRQKQVVLCGRRLLLPLNHTSGINFANAEILTDSSFCCGNVSWSCFFWYQRRTIRRTSECFRAFLDLFHQSVPKHCLLDFYPMLTGKIPI